jgi:VWFA-related protein
MLFDNGVRQSIDAVTMSTMPIDVTFVANVNLSVADALPRVREAMERVRGRLSTDDRISVIDCATTVRTIVPMQSARHLAPLNGPSSPVQQRSRGRVLSAGFVFDGASLNDAVFLALAWPVEPGRRHLIVLFTDGVDTWSTIDADALLSLASRADAVVHFVMSEPKPDPAQENRGGGVFVTQPIAERSEPVIATPPTAAALRRHLASWNAITKIAEQSGGSLHAMTNIEDTFAAILDDFRGSYVLRYTLAGVDRTGWHDIRVKVTRPGSFTIRARKGYSG